MITIERNLISTRCQEMRVYCGGTQPWNYVAAPPHATGPSPYQPLLDNWSPLHKTTQELTEASSECATVRAWSATWPVVRARRTGKVKIDDGLGSSWTTWDDYWYEWWLDAIEERLSKVRRESTDGCLGCLHFLREIAIFVPKLLPEAHFGLSTFKTSSLILKQSICRSISFIPIN